MMRVRHPFPFASRIHTVSLLFLTQAIFSTAKLGILPRDLSGTFSPTARSSVNIAPRLRRLEDFHAMDGVVAAKAGGALEDSIPPETSSRGSRSDYEILRHRRSRRQAADDPIADPLLSAITDPLLSAITDPLLPILTSLLTPIGTLIPTTDTTGDTTTTTPTLASVFTSSTLTTPPTSTTHSRALASHRPETSSVSSSPSVTLSASPSSRARPSRTLSFASLSPSPSSSSSSPSPSLSFAPPSSSSSSSSTSSSSSSTPTLVPASNTKPKPSSVVAGTAASLLVIGGLVITLCWRRRRPDSEQRPPAYAEEEWESAASSDAGGGGSMRPSSAVLLLGPDPDQAGGGAHAARWHGSDVLLPGNPSGQASDTSRTWNLSGAVTPLSAAPSSSLGLSPAPRHTSGETSKDRDNRDSGVPTPDRGRPRSGVHTFGTLDSDYSPDRAPPTPLPLYTPSRPLPSIPSRVCRAVNTGTYAGWLVRPPGRNFFFCSPCF
ncbi:hypothetical protein B0H12DRAFT_1167786 [Mycena haematopus]|nr:hypothetical protein B0H12DRAFT_1167786 [Mycena haematopus]